MTRRPEDDLRSIEDVIEGMEIAWELIEVMPPGEFEQGGRIARATRPTHEPPNRQALDPSGASSTVDAETRAAIDAFKVTVAERYGDRLDRVVLYGSHARGEATESSDVDLLLILKDDVQPGREIDALADLIWELLVEHGVLLSVLPVSAEDYGSRQSPLLINARRDGVPA